MKIKIVEPISMGVMDLKHGDTVDVYWSDQYGVYIEKGSPHRHFVESWSEDGKGFFQFIKEDIFSKDNHQDYKLAWQTVWDSICKNCPEDMMLDMLSSGSGIDNAVEYIEMMSESYKDNVKTNPFKVGDHVKIIVSEGELLDCGCDESVQSGGVYTVQEVEEESLRLGPEDTCSWVAWSDVESAKQASALDSMITFTMNNKDLEICIEDGKITARDWKSGGEPVEYNFDTIEQLEEFMNAWGNIAGRRS